MNKIGEWRPGKVLVMAETSRESSSLPGQDMWRQHPGRRHGLWSPVNWKPSFLLGCPAALLYHAPARREALLGQVGKRSLQSLPCGWTNLLNPWVGCGQHEMRQVRQGATARAGPHRALWAITAGLLNSLMRNIKQFTQSKTKHNSWH